MASRFSQTLVCSDNEHISWAGRVENLKIVNFMCHSNLDIVFNPRINFIIGKNGSGKSAIMAALVVVLGGSAKNTERASGVAELIKAGENTGKVSIVLLNEGVNAYKPEIYGNRIQITRSFTRAQSSSYSIKSASGLVISKKKEEVENIKEALQLLITNPICVLNQDVARSFLGNSNSASRFDIFMQSTQLKALEDHYNATANNLDESFKHLTRTKLLLDERKKEVDEMTEKLKYIATLEKHVVEIARLEEELLWSEVSDIEAKLAELKMKLQCFNLEKAKIIEARENYEATIKELQDKKDDISTNINIDKEIELKLLSDKKDLHNSILTFDKQISEVEQEIKVFDSKLRKTRVDIQIVEEYMKQDNESVYRHAEEQANCQKKMADISSLLVEIKDNISLAKVDVDNAKETRMKTLEKLNTAISYAKNLDRLKAGKLSSLASMQETGDVELIKYGNYVPKLLQAIDSANKQGKFKHKPIGPCGRYVKLSGNKKWIPAIESSVGSLMTAFCCDNKDDSNVLVQIFEKVLPSSQRQPTVIVSKFLPQRHNVGNAAVRHRGLQTIFDCLTFTNDTVFNTFIDQIEIERILLFESDEQAMSYLSLVENVPKGTKLGITLNCDTYYPAPNYGTFGGKTPKLRFFVSNQEDMIARLKSEINDCTNEITENIAKQNELKKQLDKSEDFSKRSSERLNNFLNRKVDLDAELRTLKDQELSRPVPRNRAVLEEELGFLNKQVEKYNLEKEKKQEVLNQFQAQKSDVVKKAASVSKTIKEVKNTLNILESNYGQIEEDIRNQTSRNQSSQKQLSSLEVQIKSYEESEISIERELGLKTIQADMVCPRIRTIRPSNVVIKLLEKKRNYVKAAESYPGSKEVIVAEYYKKKEQFDRMKNDLGSIESSINFIKDSLKKRKDIFIKKQQLTAEAVAHAFQAYLMTRGINGMAIFNFQEKSLELEIKPHNDACDKRTDTKTLSGGERSFATVCFILAIWRTVRMPFYFLDEFDVFMDKVNRKVVMDLLLENANDSSGRQYVFITPQETSFVHQSDLISIYKMPDPKRKRLADGSIP